MATATTDGSSVPGRFGRVLLRVPKYLTLAANLARDTRLSGAQRAAAGLSLGYAISPIDLVPGIIPVAGQLDDLTVLIVGLRTTLRTLPRDVAAGHLARVSLDTRVMDEDLRVVGATAAWVARKGGALLGRAAVSATRHGVRWAQRQLRGTGADPTSRL